MGKGPPKKFVKTLNKNRRQAIPNHLTGQEK
jgi:hypothetical protein